MNINEVPQDKREFKEEDKLRKLVYAVGPDGRYTRVNSDGWEVENIALKQAWDDVDERLADTEARVRAGELSPIAYFMLKNLMDIALLARYMHKWQWQVKRHLKPAVFSKLSKDTLARYAGLFNITTETLISFGRNSGTTP